MTERDGVYVNLEQLIRLKHQGQGVSFLPRQPIHSLLVGQKASKLRGRGLNFEEIRDYLPGDDIRSIDWKVTARMRKPHTRVYSEERDRQTLVIVDQRIGMFFGSDRSMKSVTAAEAAALAAWRVVGVGDRIGALVFNDTDIEEIKPHRSTKIVMRILEVIVRYNRALKADNPVKAKPERLNEVLERACRLAKHDTLVCVISDFDGADEVTKTLMNRLAQNNDIIAGFVYDPLEAELPNAGQLIAGDGELQVDFNSGSSDLRRRFAEGFADRRAAIEDFLFQRQMPLLSLQTNRPVPEQIRERLGFRKKPVPK